MHITFAASLWPAARSNLAYQALLAVIGSVLLFASAQVQIPVQPVPFTLQTMVLLLIGAAYGPWLGAATAILYIAEGLVGLPVFQEFKTGAQVYYTAGYLAGFPIAAFVAGWFTRSNRIQGVVPALVTALIAFLVADAIVFALGYTWLANLIGADKAWAGGVAPFLLWDGVKVALAALITTGAWRTLSTDRIG